MDRRAYYPLGTWGNQRSKQSRPCPCCLRTIENIRAAWRQREDRKSKAAENEKLRISRPKQKIMSQGFPKFQKERPQATKIAPRRAMFEDAQ